MVIVTKRIHGIDYLYEQHSYRDENGKVITEGRYIGRADGKPAYDVLNDRTMTLAQYKSNLFTDTALKHRIHAVARLVKKGYTTKNRWYDKENNKYKDDRINEVHNKIFRELDNEAAYPEGGKKPVVVFLGGPPGSGKTTVLAGDIDKKQFVVLDNDAIKAKLPEYNGTNAALLHDEATDIYEKAGKIAQAKGQNILFDATLKSTDKAADAMREYRDKGYEVVLIATNLSKDKTMARATQRAMGEAGRYVALEYIYDNTDKINDSVRLLTSIADRYIVYDTDVPKGKPARIILQG